MTRKLYSTPQWRRTRLAVLARDNHLCRIQLTGCTLKATEVDHIIPLTQGGSPYDPDNLRASCRHCNSSRQRPQRHQPPSRNW